MTWEILLRSMPFCQKKILIYQHVRCARKIALRGLKLGIKVAHKVNQGKMADQTKFIFSPGKYGGIHMSKKIRVILRNGLELTYEDARVVEGKKTWIYQVNESEYPEELLALIDPRHIKALYAED